MWNSRSITSCQMVTVHVYIAANPGTRLTSNCLFTSHIQVSWNVCVSNPCLETFAGMGQSEVWLALGLGTPLLLFALIYRYSQALQISKGGAQVPPGTFWMLPFFGETIQFLTTSPDDFVLPRLSRYGRSFRTHLFGFPTISITTVDVSKFVLQSPKLFISKHPHTLQEILGKDAISQVEGEMHIRYRRLIQATLVPDALKAFIPDVDKMARQMLENWAQKGSLVAHEELRKFTFHVALLFTCDTLKFSPETEMISGKFSDIERGLLSFPINLPGTVYNKALKAREVIMDLLHRIIQERRQEDGSLVHEDMLQSFLTSEDNGKKLSDDQVADNMLLILFAAHDTSALALLWILHNLLLYPNILEQVKVEQDAVARQRKHADDPITQDDLRNMPFTMRVIQETLRTANIAGFTTRQATQDVNYNGILFPKGWRVMIWFRYYHLDTEVYKEARSFDPSRFQILPKPNTFTPFGNGNRVCPGSELAKMEILVTLHRLVSNYDFEREGEKDWTVAHLPLPHFKTGLPLKITRRHEEKGKKLEGGI